MKRTDLVILGIVLAGFVALAMLYFAPRTKSQAGPVSTATHGLAEKSSTASAKPIRFVKDPESAPPFELRDISGNVASSAGLKGKVILLAFWATWCPPCREEIPTFIELQEKYKDHLQIVGISEDDDPPEKVLRFAQQKGINYPVVMATPALIDSYGGVPALPTVFLIDTQGRVVQKHVGVTSFEDYEREVRALLGLPVDAPIETFADNGQVFLKNAANATELPGVNMAGLTPAQKKTVLHRLNSENCTCGCMLTISECRINDTACPVSVQIAANVVNEVRSGKSNPPAGAAATAAPGAGANP